MAVVKLERVNVSLADYPAKLREIADDLKMDCPPDVRQLAADRLDRYATELEHFVVLVAAALRDVRPPFSTDN